MNILVELSNKTMKNINNTLKIEHNTSTMLKSFSKRHAKLKNQSKTHTKH